MPNNEVTGNGPSSRYAFQVVAGPVRPRGEFRFAPSGGGVEVQLSLAAEIGAPRRSVLCGPVQKSMDRETAALDRAKAAVEGR